jgi:hypothetical protein
VLLLLASLLAGCGADDADPTTTDGYSLYDNFPLDGERRWVYASDDASVAHHLEIVMVPEAETLTGAAAHELQRWNQDTGAHLGSAWWSSDSSDGIQIHAYQDPGSPRVDLDPPAAFAAPRMDPGDAVESSAGGWDFVSTFIGGEPCENHWVGDDWDRCLHVRLDAVGSDDGDGDAGAPFAGDYWLVPRYGAAWIQATGDTDTWVLLNAFWEAT